MTFRQKFLPFALLELCAVYQDRPSVFAARLTPDIRDRKPHFAIRVINGPDLKLANCFTGTASLICKQGSVLNKYADKQNKFAAICQSCLYCGISVWQVWLCSLMYVSSVEIPGGQPSSFNS